MALGKGDIGPCVARLSTFGDILELVLGAFGEVSADMDRVVSALAESRVLFLSRVVECDLRAASSFFPCIVRENSGSLPRSQNGSPGRGHQTGSWEEK